VWLFRAGDHAPAGRRADWRLAAAEALAIVTDLGDWGRLSRLELSLAMIEAPLDPAAAERWLDRATESARRSGNPQEIAYLAQVRGRVASMTGRLTEAQRWFRESQARFQAIDDHRFELSARSELGHALRRDDRIDEAEATALLFSGRLVDVGDVLDAKIAARLEHHSQTPSPVRLRYRWRAIGAEERFHRVDLR